MIGYEEIHNALFRSSVIERTNRFKSVIEELDIHADTIVEVGTNKGLSAAALASICKRVYTFDLTFKSIAEPLWKILNVYDKITYTMVKSTQDISDFLKVGNIPIEFAYADGPHIHYKDVITVFKMLRDAGAKRILFDDANENWPGTVQVMEEIGAKIYVDRFGYWEREEK